MNALTIKSAFKSIADIMTQNREYLIYLDQQNGDGDLGISMQDGFQAINNEISISDEKDIGVLLHKAAMTMNDAAPSTLGTIISFGILGMAKNLKGKYEFSLHDLCCAFESGALLIMQRSGAKLGEKTIIDSLVPAIEALKENVDRGEKEALNAALNAATIGSEETRKMTPVHGRAVYYRDKSLNTLDGGSVVAKLIFEGIFNCSDRK